MSDIKNLSLSILEERKKQFEGLKNECCQALKEIESEGVISNILINYIVDHDYEDFNFNVYFQFNFTQQNEEKIKDLIKGTNKKDLSKTFDLVKYLCNKNIIPSPSPKENDMVEASLNNFLLGSKEYLENGYDIEDMFVIEEFLSNQKEKSHILCKKLEEKGFTSNILNKIIKNQTFFSTEYNITSDSFIEVDGNIFSNVRRNQNLEKNIYDGEKISNKKFKK